LHLSLKLKKVYIEYISFFPEGKKMNLLVEIYPEYLTKCQSMWIVSTVRGRGGSIRLPKSGAAPVITSRQKRQYATGAVARAGR